MAREQTLVDISFQLVATMHLYPDMFKNKTMEQKMEWVAEQLRQCGFPTQPCGASWGVLTENLNVPSHSIGLRGPNRR